MKPSTAAVLTLLRARGSMGVTELEAIAAVHQTRLAARVWELRAAGYDVRCDKREGFGRYVLVEQPEQIAQTR